MPKKTEVVTEEYTWPCLSESKAYITSRKDIDYTAVESHKLGGMLRDDAGEWAKAFCQHAQKHGLDIDEGWMITWFANAIEVSHDFRTR